MERQPVTSSNIRSVGYDPETQTLEIEFSSGGVYTYANVPAEEHAAFIAAPSVGRHFGERIRPAYVHTKVS